MEIRSGERKLAEIVLEAMSLNELKRLKKDVTKAIEDFDARQQRKAIAAVEAKAHEMGFTFAELAAAAPTKIWRKPKSPPKYKHPENSALTWTGKGRRPTWVKERLEAGQSLNEFLIGA